MASEFKVPQITNNSLCLLSWDNFINGKVHVYWLPTQQQEDAEDPSYQLPNTGTPFPDEFNLLQHPKVIRVLSDSGSTSVAKPTYTINFDAAPLNEGGVDPSLGVINVSGSADDGSKGVPPKSTYTISKSGQPSQTTTTNSFLQPADMISAATAAIPFYNLGHGGVGLPYVPYGPAVISYNDTTSNGQSPNSWTANISKINLPPG